MKRYHSLACGLWTALAATLTFAVVACGNSGNTQTAPPSTTVAAGQATATPTPRPVKITYAISGTGFSNGLPLLAKEKGFFAKEGLDVEIVTSPGGPVAAAALAGGSVQVTSMSFSHVVDAVDNGIELIAFANTSSQAASKLVMRADYAKKMNITKQSSLKDKVAALKGARIGVTSPGSGTDRFARAALALGGLDPKKDAVFVFTKDGATADAALRAGRIEAFVGPNPSGPLAEHGGYGLVILSAAAGDVPDFHNLPNTVQATSGAYIKNNRDVIERVVRALVNARKYVDSNFDDSLEVMRKAYYPDDSIEVLRIAATDDWKNGLSKDFVMAEADAARFSELTLDHKLKRPFASYFTSEFVKK